MKEKNQNTQLKNKKEKKLNKKVIAIGTTAIVALATILAVFMLNRNNNLASLSPEIARSMEYEQVQEGDENLEETNNVKFDAFFLRDLDGDGYAESIRGTCNEIGEESTLYMELNVLTEGYLKDGKITINSDNFYLQTNLPKDEELADNYIGNNIKEIGLNQINNGTQKLITGIVRSGDYTYSSGKANAIGSNINNYSKVNSVTLTGTYVYTDEEGQEQNIEISKTVDFTVDWHGRTSASISNTYQSKYIEDLIDEENGKINLTFTVNTNETRQELLLGKNHTEVEIPELNGYAPLEVVYTGSNATTNYNEETKILTLERTSTLAEDGTVTNKLSTSNSYSVRVTYPLEAYTSLGTDSVQIKIPASTYYEGYNNTNDEFTNPYLSNTAKATIVANFQKYQGTQSRFDITVGNYVSSPTYRYIVSKQKPLRLYNGQSEEERDDTYIVKWQAYIGTNSNLGSIVMKETQNDSEQVVDQFIKSDSTEESMEDVTTNVGIYFSGADRMLGTDGYINVYDEETDNLLVTFTSSDWNRYTSSNPYRYETSVKHIRVETSNIVENDAYFYVYNVKELDDEKILEKYEKEQFDELDYIKSTLVGYVGGQYVETDTHQAHYEAPFSIATISISNNTLSTQVTEENDIITIRASANTSSNQVGWVNGSFLVKLPDEMLTAELNSVEINNSNVSLESYELIEEDGQKFIKIVTKNDKEQTYDIKIDVNLTPDPRIATTTRNIELYASNENGNDYYYTAQDRFDVNNNLNTEELVNYRTTSISMVSPNSLLTNQTASDYDDKGSMVVSPQVADIKPVYAVVDQEQEEQTAKIGVQIKNNYASTISEIQILGKIPFEGNTYVLSGSSLGSTFTTKMVDTGIEIPQDLLDTATIYYSTNENPDRDLSNGENGWQTSEEVTNWDEIKTFLIDLGDYVMPTGQEYVFYYTVKIPNGLEFNQVSFSHHGVYFALDTEDGKYRTQTEPNKIGLRIAEKYNLELSKFQTGKDKLVPGATYSIQEVITKDDGTESYEDAKTGVTNSEGKLTIRNLYAERTYELREIKTPDNYELNSNVIRFIGHVDEQGILTIEKTGETRQDPEVIKNDGEEYKVAVQVEDEIKASLKLIKKEQGTDTLLYGVRYKVTGYGLPEEGKTIRTNRNGETNLNGLSINKEYTLEEVKADGYYLASPIKFKILNNNGRYEIQVTEGTVLEQNIAEENDIPVVSFTLEDEKIPTYNLQLFKIKKTTESTVNEDELIAKAETSLADTEVVPLANATFKLYKGDEELGKYTTGEDGKVTIEGLYQYESEKGIDQTYTLKEVMSPEGYAKVQDISFRVQKDEETDQLILIDESGEDRQYSVEEDTVTLTIEDSPSFKLIKKDAETKQALANIKFAIYDDNSEPARNSKGEIVGTKETINGKEYYTVQTDENGELTVDLPEGLYKAVEVQAPEQYDISNSTYYFGIGASREAPTTLAPTQATSIGGSGIDRLTSVAKTSDGGYVVGGYFASNEIELDETHNLTNAGNNDGMVIKYGADGGVEWVKAVGGGNKDYINSVATTEDGGYIVGGNFYSNSITVDGKVLNNSYSGYSCGMIIKFDEDGIAEWVKAVGGIDEYSDTITVVKAISDGSYIVGGYFGSSSITVDGIELKNNGSYDGMVIKYGADGTAQWAKVLGGKYWDEITSVAETQDGDYIVGGYFGSSSITVDEIELANNGSNDGMIIKYGADGEVKWAKAIGGSGDDSIKTVATMQNGGYIVGGRFSGDSITVGDYILKNNSGRSDFYDGMVIKYNYEGKVEWATSIGKYGDDSISSVATTSDGGYIVGGYFGESNYGGNNLTIGENTLTSVLADGLLIKYDSEGKAEWATNIGGTNNDYINSVVTIEDESYIIVGSFYSSNITVGKYIIKNNSSSTSFQDGMIIKYKQVDLNDPTTIQAISVGGDYSDQITTVTATSDGGYIAGGYFESPNIIVGEYILSNNSDYNVIDGDITDGMVIKYGADGSVQWATSIGGGSGDYINSVAESSDGGILVGGDFKSSSITVGEYTLTNSRGQDGMIIKYGADGSVEWATSLGGDYATKINSVTETRDGGIVVGGLFTSSSITVGDYTLTNAGSGDGIVIKYGVDGKVEWSTSIGGTGSDYIQSVASTSDGGIVVGGRFTSSSITVGDYNLTNAEANQSYPGEDGMVIKYGADGSVQWATSIGESDYDYIESVSETSDGEIIVGGYFRSSSITVGDYTLTNAGSYDGMVIKFGADGEVEWATRIGGDDADYIYSVAATSDGGYIVGGYFSSSSITVGNYTLTNARGYDEMVIKYDSDGEVEWAKSIGGSNYDYISAVTELNDASVIAGGYFFSSTIETDGHILTKNGSSDGMLLRIVNMTGVPEVQELTVENERKEFKITTDVNETNGGKGGSISGEDLKPYEEVKYGDNSTKEIVMTPDSDYEIVKITVNGEDYPFEENTDGTFTMPQFTNVTENIHVEVTYMQKDHKLVISKVDEHTGEALPGARFRLTQTEGEDASNLYETTVTTGEEGKAIVQLPFGKYEITEIESPYGYETIEEPITLEFTSDGEHEITIQNKELQKVIVHHYLKDTEGTLTTTKVAEDEILLGKEGEEYRTTPHLDLEKYELEKDEEGNYVIPEDANGTFDGDVEKDQEIIYYYKTKDYPLIVHHYIEGTTNPVPLRDGSLAPDEARTGKEGEEYSTKAITPEELDDKYELVEIPSNAIGIFGTEEIVVTYEYRLKQEKLKIIKQNADGEGLEGATLVIENTDNGTRRTGTTDENGEINIEFPIGNVVITETKAPDGYKLVSEPVETVVELDKDNVVTIVDEKINYFDLSLNKIDIETKEPIEETEFQLTYTTQYGEEKLENYVTAEDGTIKLYGLEDEIEYTLQETKASKGYVSNSEIYKFVVHYQDEIYNLEMLEGNFAQVVGEEDKITCTIGNDPTLKVIKQGEFGELLPNAKFTITDEEGNPVVDGNGNEVGQIENIDGQDLRVVTTDENGQIAENLEPGTYILTEVQAPTGYKLPENEEDRKTTIEITSEGYTGHTIEKAEDISLANVNLSWLDTDKIQIGSELIITDDDGNLIITGGLAENLVIPAENTVSGEDISLEKVSEMDGIILTINPEGKVVKVNQIKSPENSANMLAYTTRGKNGDITSLSVYMGELTIPAEDTQNNQEITLNGTSLENMYIICFNDEGKVKWANTSEYLELDELIYMGYIGNNFVMQYVPANQTVTIPSDKTESGEEMVLEMNDNAIAVMLIYNEEGKVSNAVKINAPNIDYSAVSYSIAKDGGMIISAYSETPLIFDSTETVTGEEIQAQGGILIKYNQEGKVEWAKSISGTAAIGAEKEVSNGYIGIMEYMGEIKVAPEDTASGEEITLTSQSVSEASTAMVKYNSQGQVEWLIDINYSINNDLMSMMIQETENGYSLLDLENLTIQTFKETPTDLIANNQALITLTNEAMDSSIIVHHYIEGTEERVPSVNGGKVEDVLINGKVGQDYTTEVATDIPANYELAEEPSNKDGKMTAEQTTVIYYYRIKDAGIEQQIEKTGTPEQITREDQQVTYNITYTGTITDYIGNAKVTITDRLPYKIDEEKSKLDGGLYDDASKTITWEENVEDIDTYTDPATGEISITKQITVTYTDMDYSKTSFDNKVQGKIELDATEQEEGPVEDTVTTSTDFTKDVTATKVWNHTNNIYGVPTQVKVQLKNGENVVQEAVLTEANKVGEDTNTWTYTFTNLPKYDSQGQEINYTVDEAEVNEGELAYYHKDIEGTTITNIYNGPVITATKSSETENNRDYVVEGETITYTIRVENSGEVGKEVVVKDEAPEGTTFVPGSIVVKENSLDVPNDYSEDNLNSGITVNVAAKGNAEVSFQVAVDELEEDTFMKAIKNTATVDGKETNEVTETVNKTDLRIGKTSEPANGEKVTQGDEIRYVIVLENIKGTLPVDVTVKDSIPEGTNFVDGSIKVEGSDESYTLEDLTTTGINLKVGAGEARTVEFKVTVQDLDNGDTITNIATVNDVPTNEVTHNYVEAIIEANKEQETERGLSYVIPGEKITYTIRIKNTGELSKKIIVKDNIPEGTEFVEDSVLLNGTQSNVTKEQLESGIEVESTPDSEQTISFTVTVQEGATEVKNSAVVDNKETNETKVPVLAYEKTAEVIRQTAEEIPEGTVTAGDKIKYTIRVNNLGEEPVTNVTVKDVVPEGTTLSKTSIGGAVNDKNEITWTIDSIAVGKSAEVSFEVTVNYDVVDSKNITNIASIDGKDTNETETPYEKPEIKEESTIEKTGTEIINSTEDSITYQITYNATIKDFVGEGKVTLVDYLPYEIDVEKQYLDGGFYDSNAKTITWEEDLGSIDTYTNGDKTVNIEKNITVKYVYGEDAETLEGTIPNRVEGKLELIQKDPEKPGEDKVVLEDTKEATFETKVQIPTYIIVHHYIEGTTQKVPSKVYGEVVEDETKEGFVGQDYTTSASSNVQENYKVVSNTGNTTGIMTRTPIEVIYYYRLQPGDITENTITKEGTDKIINKDDKVSYTISYTGRVENYVGNAKVEIVDYLPYAIDEAISELNGGLYNPANNTITWVEDLGRVNTYTDEAKDISITKNIEVVFTQMNCTSESFTNRAKGKIILEETKQEQETPEASKETETEFVKDITVEKVWDDNDDIKGRRPDSVTVQLTAGGKVVDNIEDIISAESTNNNSENATTEGTTESTETTESEYKVVLNAENNWTHTFQDLPKYTEDGQEISYSVVETETNKGDLEYYEKPDIQVFDTDTTATVRVTNKYKLMNTFLDAKIEKTGTDLVTSSSQEVNYNIKYNATVEDYIGASLVTITDYLPYAIDETKSNLDGGTYDALTNTIVWTENIDHINTYENGDYPVSIEKNITVVFTNLDATAKAMVNRVTGRINLYENETTNTVETTYETKIEIPGNVIVKYVDRNTGVEIAESYELKGLAGDAYTTEQKEIYGYTFVESTNNTSGNMIEGTIEVIYYYERTNAGGVIVHYVDEEGNKLADDVTITGKVADPYRTEQKDIPNYDFVRVEGQTEGEMIEGVIEVTYIYKKIPARVIVQHLEKDDTPDDNTDNVVLAEEEIIEGFSGDAYSTARKEIENYKPADPEPENSTGTMTREDIYVTYYYERKPSGIVTVKYVDVDTNEEILHKVQTEDGEEYTSYREQMSGLCGLEYTTEQKDIPFYNFVEELRPTNATGVYTEEDIEVIYYYRKQTFNLSVNKQIDKITVNGVEHSLKDELNQIDVVASKVQETDIVVTYKIIVSNPSEIEGTAKVQESIPDFFRVADGTSTEWAQIANKTLEAEVTLKPGETKELIVVLNWIKNSSNFGLQLNTVTLTNISNPANYEETNLEDNTDTAEAIFSVKTGGIDTSIIIGTALVIMLGTLVLTIYLKEKRKK